MYDLESLCVECSSKLRCSAFSTRAHSVIDVWQRKVIGVDPLPKLYCLKFFSFLIIFNKQVIGLKNSILGKYRKNIKFWVSIISFVRNVQLKCASFCPIRVTFLKFPTPLCIIMWWCVRGISVSPRQREGASSAMLGCLSSVVHRKTSLVCLILLLTPPPQRVSGAGARAADVRSLKYGGTHHVCKSYCAAFVATDRYQACIVHAV